MSLPSGSPASQPSETQPPAELGRVEPAQVRVPLTKPLVTYILLGVTVGVYLLQMLSRPLFGYDLLLAMGAKSNTLIQQGEFWRLITPMFLHVSLPHIAFNMYALYAFGVSLERHYGRRRFLLLYFIGGLGGVVLSYLLSPENSAGASTALFGVVAAEAVFLYYNRRWFGKEAVSALWNTVFIIGINLVLGLSPGIDNWGHLGGLIAGGVFAALAGPLLALRGEYPNLSLEDTRSLNRAFVVAVAEAGVLLFLVLMTFF
ncbi:rhomboid family intramembrane serine protease [Anaerolinea thermophila]|uniref:Rhomboid family protein n=1 Tax=Anaerolinea thermophila (strain DSM 14523 / JCM 11388 / NBRC 100420 / UNI-1) TaxID=926569 RepID=E8N296_ANATU|nr:rhomboid family intramembrane serine protease [Anaerolinea thermophila]BAJ65043.1 rhomboid family protein [Anaerolinea thermophila UNI-1]